MYLKLLIDDVDVDENVSVNVLVCLYSIDDGWIITQDKKVLTFVQFSKI